VRLKFGPYGPYVELAPPSDAEKPKRASIPKDKDPATVDLAYALKLLELPRTVGRDPRTGEEIVAGLGRFGPFVRRGKTFASLKGTDALWTVTPEEAAAMLDAKAAGKRLPLRELGKHPATGADVVVMSGRYGPYVTDGVVNATIPKGMEPEDLDLESALKMLAKKAGRGGGARRRGERARGGRAPEAKRAAKGRARRKRHAAVGAGATPPIDDTGPVEADSSRPEPAARVADAAPDAAKAPARRRKTTRAKKAP
jgi:DNA topoisomerase-1